MRPILRYVKAQREEIVSTIRQLVQCESPSDSSEHINACVELLIELTRDIAEPKIFRSANSGNHVRLDFRLHARSRGARILGLGHSDTVWPVGSLKTMPWRRSRGRLWGPGVLDMKAGLAFFVHAVRALQALDLAPLRPVSLLVVGDEETGSHHSRELTEKEAQTSGCVLVVEPGSGLDGKLKTARKGIGAYRLTVRGIASHAGVDFEAGASAILEIARQVERISALTDLARGVTLNPGVISGGTRSNVIAAEAYADIDLRVVRLRDAAAVDRRLRALRPLDKRCVLHIEGGLNRPPMERSKAIVKLFDEAKEIGAELGVEVQESATGGGSDGNFTAALGIPTLDGLGAIGEGAHARTESILINRIVDRTALLAGLLSRL